MKPKYANLYCRLVAVHLHRLESSRAQKANWPLIEILFTLASESLHGHRHKWAFFPSQHPQQLRLHCHKTQTIIYDFRFYRFQHFYGHFFSSSSAAKRMRPKEGNEAQYRAAKMAARELKIWKIILHRLKGGQAAAARFSLVSVLLSRMENVEWDMCSCCFLYSLEFLPTFGLSWARKRNLSMKTSCRHNC